MIQANRDPQKLADQPPVACEQPSPPRRVPWFGGVLAGTILVSAFLLFQVQPLISKCILPWFGGSPAVWTTCMLFFQIVLFGGYAYAHISEHVLGPRLRTIVHLCLLVLAVAMLPILPSPAWKPPDSNNPTARILGLLLVSVGLPYFVLSSTGPLLQAWFSRAYPDRVPYRLYALSNFGSLAALLSYPFLFEPRWSVQVQGILWSGLFVLFALLCGYGVIVVQRLTAGAPADRQRTAAGLDQKVPSWSRRLLWVGLPALASLMLLATTNHVCQNVAVIPFLWVVPLSLYLISFIICFDHERWYRRGLCGGLTVLLILITVADDEWIISLSFRQSLAVYFAAMFAMCMVCHGELVRLRPSPRYLTMFYLMIAAGGAVGGILVSLVAPVVFNRFWEWKIGLVAGYLLAAGLVVQSLRSHLALRRYPTILVAGTALVGLGSILYWQSDTGSYALDRARNFYGIVSVVERAKDRPNDHDYALFSGNVIHGTQFVAPAKRRFPTAYYGPDSGVGRTLSYFRNRQDLRVGAVGLGAGTVAAHAQSGQYFRFYEINPEMLRLARTRFTYLGDCRGQYDVILGDARLSLERETSQHFDVLILDAFSGDAIPVHLLTQEAVAMYLKHLVPEGVVCVHITNTYLDLACVVRGLGEKYGLETLEVSSRSDHTWDLEPSHWMLLSRNHRFLADMSAYAQPKPQAARCLLWTDGYSNLFDILKVE